MESSIGGTGKPAQRVNAIVSFIAILLNLKYSDTEPELSMIIIIIIFMSIPIAEKAPLILITRYSNIYTHTHTYVVIDIVGSETIVCQNERLLLLSQKRLFVQLWNLVVIVIIIQLNLLENVQNRQKTHFVLAG